MKYFVPVCKIVPQTRIIVLVRKLHHFTTGAITNIIPSQVLPLWPHNCCMPPGSPLPANCVKTPLSLLPIAAMVLQANQIFWKDCALLPCINCPLSLSVSRHLHNTPA